MSIEHPTIDDHIRMLRIHVRRASKCPKVREVGLLAEAVMQARTALNGLHDLDESVRFAPYVAASERILHDVSDLVEDFTCDRPVSP